MSPQRVFDTHNLDRVFEKTFELNDSECLLNLSNSPHGARGMRPPPRLCPNECQREAHEWDQFPLRLERATGPGPRVPLDALAPFRSILSYPENERLDRSLSSPLPLASRN